MNFTHVMQGDHVQAMLDDALEAGGGLLRSTLARVPRSIWCPSQRIKLNPDHDYAYGASRRGRQTLV